MPDSKSCYPEPGKCVFFPASLVVQTNFYHYSLMLHWPICMIFLPLISAMQHIFNCKGLFGHLDLQEKKPQNTLNSGKNYSFRNHVCGHLTFSLQCISELCFTHTHTHTHTYCWYIFDKRVYRILHLGPCGNRKCTFLLFLS